MNAHAFPYYLSLGDKYEHPPLEKNEGIGCFKSYLCYPTEGIDNFVDIDEIMFNPQGLQIFIDLLAALPIPPGSVQFTSQGEGTVLAWYPQYKLRPNTEKQLQAVLKAYYDYTNDIPLLRLNPWPCGYDSPVKYPNGAPEIKPNSHTFTRDKFFNGRILYSCRSHDPIVDDLNGERLTGNKLYSYLYENNIESFW